MVQTFLYQRMGSQTIQMAQRRERKIVYFRYLYLPFAWTFGIRPSLAKEDTFSHCHSCEVCPDKQNHRLIQLE